MRRHCKIELYYDVKDNGCWIWTGSLKRSPCGMEYGLYSIPASMIPGATRSKTVLAHRYMYELHKCVKIKEGMSLDHTCNNSLCVNPDHLEEVTASENLRRSYARGSWNPRARIKS